MAKPEEIQRIKKIAWDLRADVVKMIGVGKAGHLGGSCSLAEIVAALYFGKMHFDPKALKDPDRDRFLVSKGHSVLIQYAALVELGAIPREEMGKLKTLGGILQGHPDMMTPGIEAVTGSLGQGLSIANGMALTLRLKKSPARVYVVMGDGELAEGQLWEAAMASARYKLDSLTAHRGSQPNSGHWPDEGDLRHPQHRREVAGVRMERVDRRRTRRGRHPRCSG